MLQLKNIVKKYKTGDTSVEALKSVSLAFRENEFVSILGPSGCGKTTLLNIIGGLDVYDSGDLVINNRSTKEYKAKDWDTYRNHSVGFVFQSYNLIGHQTVLSNVELALTLSGVSKTERRKRAKEALEMVGLGDQIHKKPNQMSGGQMQRVAIARALVNNPDILLADEPTGALDTQTSVAIMDILKEIAKDRLIIMVTHNPELAELYSTRIVKLLDGNVINDTEPYTQEMIDADIAAKEKAAEKAQKDAKKGKKSMSFFTALSLSFNNLMTKRGRTLLTSFAGSIGIIGISLILALSTGIQAYIDGIQRDTLSSYPLTIEAEEGMIGQMLSAMSEMTPETMDEAQGEKHGDEAIYSNPMMFTMFNTFYATDESDKNNLTGFKQFLDREMNKDTSTTDLYKYASTVQYGFNVPMNTYVKNTDGKYVSTEIQNIFGSDMISENDKSSDNTMYSMLSANSSMIDLWEELPANADGTDLSDMVYDDYELLYGKFPKAANEVMLIVDKDNEIPDIAFYSLGLMSSDEVMDFASAAINGKELSIESRELTYADACTKSFKLLLNYELYNDNDGDGVYSYIGDDEAMLNMMLDGAFELKVVGVVKSTAEASAMGGAMSSVFAYTPALTDYMFEKTAQSALVQAQLDDKNNNFSVISGLPFVITEAVDPTDEDKAQLFKDYVATLDEAGKAELYQKMIAKPDQSVIDETVEQYMSQYGTREQMENLAAQSFGMDIETIKTYLESYTDEQLQTMMREQIAKSVEAQYQTQAENRVYEIMNTPSEEETDLIAKQILATLTTNEMKIGYIAQSWAESTTMAQDTILMYLASLTQEQLDAAAYSVACVGAVDLYASMASSDNRNAKVAAAYDEQFGGVTDVATLAGYYDDFMPSRTSDLTFDETLDKIGAISADAPTSINIYASSFENKDQISKIIEDFNATASEEDKIEYTDYVGLLMSGITDIINAISYGLIAFVSISLVVSSIMIGIITYISVLERTKEIGILRSIGASKHDISLVFNAETLIVGFCAGAIGIGISLLACIPINLLLHALTGINTINAFLTPMSCIVLVLISMFLTFIAGLIPSRIAAKKDPVEALRTE